MNKRNLIDPVMIPELTAMKSLLLIFVLFLTVFLTLPASSSTEASKVTTDSHQVVTEQKSEEYNKDGAIPIKDLLAFLGTIGAALIAGVFALYQLRRSIAAQRALEREKLATARKESELAELRSSRKEYQQSQVLPFLEQLDKALLESYNVAHFPPYFPDLGGYIPQLRKHADQAIEGWLMAAEEMARHRMRLLLVLSQERIKIVTSLLTQFVDLMQKMIETRNRVWFKQASNEELWEIQRAYIQTGYRLMMEIKDAAISIPKDELPLSEEAKDTLAKALTLPFEKASVVGVPYGSVRDYSWVSLWEIDIRPEWQQFIESMSHTNHEEFEEQLRNLTQELYNQGVFLDVQMSRVSIESLQVSCLAVKLPSEDRLRKFVEIELEKYREKYLSLWSSHRAPLEFTIGLENSPQKSLPNNAINSDS